MRRCKHFVCLVLLFACVSMAQWNTNNLGTFGIATLSDPQIAKRISERFRATGSPLFLLSNPTLGLQQGDLIRFTDRAYLIDADVWQTLQKEGALKAIRVSPIVRVQAKAQASSWESRSKQAQGSREGKAYKLGATLLQMLEKSFGGLPDGQKLQLSFENGTLVLVAPASFLEKLRPLPSQMNNPSTERTPVLRSAPKIISPVPDSIFFVGQPFRWTVWAIDTAGGNSQNIRYLPPASLPKGLAWNAKSHSVEGSFDDPQLTKIVVKVEDDQSRQDSMAIYVRVEKNQPPVLEGEPAHAVQGEIWSFKPIATDPEETSNQLHIKPLRLPDFAQWDSTTGIVTGFVRNSHPLSQVELALEVRDSYGNSNQRTWLIPISSTALHLSNPGKLIHYPWDTLYVGRKYVWKPVQELAQWHAQGAKFLSVSGCMECRWADSTVHLHPNTVGQLPITSTFQVQGLTRTQQDTFVVLQNRSPEWISENSGVQNELNQKRWYKPIAHDPEGGVVSYRLIASHGDSLRWQNQQWVLIPQNSGWTQAQVQAMDAEGNTVTQNLLWKTQSSLESNWHLATRWQSHTQPWESTWELGNGRIGLFTPNLNRMIGWKTWATQQWPFVFVGGNLLGTKQARQGNQLFGDIGITLRVPNDRMATGGVMARLDGHWKMSQVIHWRCEFESIGWVNQSLLIVDTAGLRLTIAEQEELGSVLDIKDRLQKNFEHILAESYRRDNAVFLTRLEAWIPIGAGIWAGTGIWREDFPLLRQWEQRVGGGARGTWKMGPVIVEPSVRGGWGPDKAGWGVWSSLQVRRVFGS